jgi:hypothetical protein
MRMALTQKSPVRYRAADFARRANASFACFLCKKLCSIATDTIATAAFQVCTSRVGLGL